VRRAAVLALALLAACVSGQVAEEAGTSGLGGAAGAGLGALAGLGGGMVTLLAMLGAAIADVWYQASGEGGVIDERSLALAFFSVFFWPSVLLGLFLWLAPNPAQLVRKVLGLLRALLRRFSVPADGESPKDPIVKPAPKRTPRRAARGLRLPRD